MTLKGKMVVYLLELTRSFDDRRFVDLRHDVQKNNYVGVAA